MAKAKQEAAAVWMPIGDLTPWADNPRDNATAIPEVARSIKRFGFASPIIARPVEGGGFEIIAGHTRHQAAQSIGLDRVPVRVMDLDPTDAKLLAIADNRMGELADWSEGLGPILQSLQDDGVDLSCLGWGDDLPEFEELPDYDILDDEPDDFLDDLAENVRKAIQVEFKADDYEQAYLAFQAIRARGDYLGGVILSCLAQFEGQNEA